MKLAMTYREHSFGYSDPGCVRESNEDVFCADPLLGLYILADGIGGHLGGEVAAEMAVATLHDFLKTHECRSIEEGQNTLKEAIAQANSVVFAESSQNVKLLGMGTTLTCFFSVGSTLIFGHVGDSRLYRFRKGVLTRLTEDHNLPPPKTNILTRAVGTQPQVYPMLGTQVIEANDLYFLCSDGLSDPLSDAHITTVLTQNGSMERMTHALIQLAIDQGSSDNITVLMVEYL